MNHVRPMRLAGFLCTLALAAFGQYSVRQVGDIIRLEDARSQTVVSVMPSRGNNAFEMKVKGNNVLQFPFTFISKALLPREGITETTVWLLASSRRIMSPT